MPSIKNNAPMIDNISASHPITQIGHGRCLLTTRLLIVFSISIGYTLPGFIFIMSVVMLGCTPPAAISLPKCPEPFWKQYTSFQSHRVLAEQTRLESLLTTGDTASPDTTCCADSAVMDSVQKLSGLEIRERLYELSIHHANPNYNFDKIFEYVSFLYQHGGPDSLRYLNWGRVVREHKAFLQQRDSLEAVIASIFEGEKKESRSIESLKQEIKSCVKQRDSLSAIITTQQQMITKLQKLDVLMEQQRNKIQ